ncbi:toprim domain-containing protein [Salininema proteolyticum]|uniref:Topoisomerase n=1 Tax=Salininema proteolyticum TaxID=1607685 RepID=A0ABV8TYV4_9ACTN
MTHEALRPLPDSSRKMLREATEAYAGQLTPAVRGYLAGRGLDEKTVRAAALGYVGNPLPGFEHVRGRLAIPYRNQAGVVGMRFRCLHAHDCRAAGHGKYMALPGMQGRLYMASGFRFDQPEAHVPEGELDALVLASLGLNVAGVPGANAWRPHYGRLLAGFPKVYTWGDPDTAGQKFNAAITKDLRAAEPVPLEAGDVTETWQQHGPDKLTSLIPR